MFNMLYGDDPNQAKDQDEDLLHGLSPDGVPLGCGGNVGGGALIQPGQMLPR